VVAAVVGRGLEVDGWNLELELEGEVHRILIDYIFKWSFKCIGLQRFNVSTKFQLTHSHSPHTAACLPTPPTITYTQRRHSRLPCCASTAPLPPNLLPPMRAWPSTATLNRQQHHPKRHHRRRQIHHDQRGAAGGLVDCWQPAST
jgi:hypothetical protein